MSNTLTPQNEPKAAEYAGGMVRHPNMLRFMPVSHFNSHWFPYTITE